MRSFLEEVVDEVWKKHEVLEDLIFVLPSKRAGSFLKNILARTTSKTLFSPKIYSIEAFVEEISGLAKGNNTQLLFELYSTYLAIADGEKDSFYDFSKWGQMLLQDYNEVDRYLIDPKKIFSYLSEIQELNHWYLKAEKTQLMHNYIQFWKQLPQLYKNYTANLLDLGVGHQGLLYRMACANLVDYQQANKNKKYIFIGFNALNTAETYIIQELLSSSESEIYWDIDHYFMEDPIHDAGFFIRKHKKTWKYLYDKQLRGLSNEYTSEKNIQIVGVPKNVSQVKYVGHLLKQIHHHNSSDLRGTAVVLGDETLLNPLLNAIPKEITSVNITMGYPIVKTPLAGMFNQFFELYIQKDSRGWFYKSVFSFLSINYVQEALSTRNSEAIPKLLEEVKGKNLVYINTENIRSFEDSFEVPVTLLFFDQNCTPSFFIDRCLLLIHALKEKFEESGNYIGLEYLYHFYTLFNQLKTMIKTYSFVDDLKSLYALFKELLSSETVDFQGEPLEGLQIMGMLESRNLDYETVIISSVNEGILPSGKANNSFIPFDLKKEFNLPTYKEKDAVYTYHFYRLLQRAKQVYILYNTQADVLEGGEKSRFISQLLTDNKLQSYISQHIATPQIQAELLSPQIIDKDQSLLAQLKNIAKTGLSPTTLSNYIRNPIVFYKKTVLNIKEVMEVEEHIAANTFGTIIHDTLEELYLPFVGSYLIPEKLEALKPIIEPTVKKHLAKSYKATKSLRGKNLIAFHVISRYIANFINLEKEDATNHQIKIIALEEKMQLDLQIPEINFPVLLKGKLDRIDEKDGAIRIIDYKTGLVNRTEVEIVDWSSLITNYQNSKAFQLLCYALMYTANSHVHTLEAGIISFKNLKAGLILFGTKDKKGSRNRNSSINQNTINEFQQHLFQLIREIYNPGIPFEEKEV